MDTKQQHTKIINSVYWVSTILFVLFDSVGALWFNPPLAIEGIRHLGFPDYFRVEPAMGKILGGILLILPIVPSRLKEWAYVGFGIACISATIGHIVIDNGFTNAFMPLTVLLVLIASYITYHKRLQMGSINKVLNFYPA